MPNLASLNHSGAGGCVSTDAQEAEYGPAASALAGLNTAPATTAPASPAVPVMNRRLLMGWVTRVFSDRFEPAWSGRHTGERPLGDGWSPRRSGRAEVAPGGRRYSRPSVAREAGKVARPRKNSEPPGEDFA